MKKSEYKKQYIELKKKRDKISDAMSAVLEAFAAEHCPLHVDDVVVICGYAHEGKQGKITEVVGFMDWDAMTWKVKGDVLKKDGTIGSQRFEFKEYHYAEYKRKELKDGTEQSV